MLRFRLLQIYRYLKYGLGWGRLPVLAVVLLGGSWGVIVSSQESSDNALLVAIGVWAGVLGLHQRRSDLRWLRVNFASSYHHIVVQEYLALGLWPALLLLIAGRWQPALLVPLSAVVGFFPQVLPSSSSKPIWLDQWFGKLPFEWRAALRQQHYFPVLGWIITYFSLWYLPYLPLVLLWLNLSVIPSIYNKMEGREILPSSDFTSPQHWLLNKMLRHSLLWLLVACPVLIGHAVLHPHIWWLPLIFGLFGAFLVAFMILSKYALYTPHQKVQGVQLMQGLALLSLVLPILLPLPIVVGIRYFRLSIQSLSPYWNARN